MLVGDHPLLVHLAIANCCAPPHIEDLPVCLLSSDVVQAMREGHVTIRRDSLISHLKPEWTIEARKPLRCPSPDSIRSQIFQRFYYVEQLDVRCIVGHTRV